MREAKGEILCRLFDFGYTRASQPHTYARFPRGDPVKYSSRPRQFQGV
jgi:hypothetical protein